MYYNYSTNFLSVFQIENIKYAEEIGMSLQYLINLKSLFTFFIDNIILGILSVVILKKRKKVPMEFIDFTIDISQELDSQVLKFVS